MTSRETPQPPPILENLNQAINDDSKKNFMLSSLYEAEDEVKCQALAATTGFHQGRHLF